MVVKLKVSTPEMVVTIRHYTGRKIVHRQLQHDQQTVW